MKSQVNRKPKILVVDDEPDNLDLLYRTFYREYKVLRATSGPAALELLAKEGDISVIISDQRMPMMSGTEFLSLRDFQEINYPKKIKRQHLFGNDNYCDSERKGLPLATPSSF